MFIGHIRGHITTAVNAWVSIKTMLRVKGSFPVSPEAFLKGNFLGFLGIDYMHACHTICTCTKGQAGEVLS